MRGDVGGAVVSGWGARAELSSQAARAAGSTGHEEGGGSSVGLGMIVGMVGDG